jgi:hypothetical protein
VLPIREELTFKTVELNHTKMIAIPIDCYCRDQFNTWMGNPKVLDAR